MAQIEISGISKSFSGNRVLKELSLSIEDGELFFLLGPSGCGKSTLLRILSGLTEPDSGKIAFDGIDVSALPPEKRQAAMVFQNYALWPNLSVFENVAFGLRTRHVRGEALKREVMNALETVHLADFADRRVPSLSGGQQQRVALARAIAVRPAVLLLDEPLSNLDARLRDNMREEILRICRERRQTAIYVTHDRREALSMASRIAVLKEGKVCQSGTPHEIYDHPVSRFVAEFLGDVNFFEGEVHNGKVTFALGTFPCECKEEGKITVGIRPEQFRIAGNGDGIDAELLRGSFFGDNCEWHCKIGDRELMVTEFAPVPRQTGEHVKLAINRMMLIRER